ncbi:MAG: chorismate mutase [Clostridia bacterium]|nr:chorismate mutase [Clostridia bacterium]
MDEKTLDLEKIRLEINETDNELVRLFLRRMELSGCVAEYKRQNNKPVFDPARERAIVNRITKDMDAEMASYFSMLYNTIFEISRAKQNKMLLEDTSLAQDIKKAKENTPEYFPANASVVCQGVEGAYSQKACERLFRRPDITYADTFRNAFEKVASGECRYGVVPIENSLHGSVTDVYDLLKEFKNRIHIVRTVKVPIHHVLLAKKGVKLCEIKEVYSHSQAIGQCSEFFTNNPQINVNVCKNTAMAAKMVSESDRSDIAAISSYDCAELYGLGIVSGDLQNSDNNHTRFICISGEFEIYPASSKIGIMFTVPHRIGSLSSILSRFTAIGVNLTKLESRPIKGRDFEFMFYAEIESYGLTQELLSYLCELDARPEEFVFLGNYTEV